MKKKFIIPVISGILVLGILLVIGFSISGKGWFAKKSVVTSATTDTSLTNKDNPSTVSGTESSNSAQTDTPVTTNTISNFKDITQKDIEAGIAESNRMEALATPQAAKTESAQEPTPQAVEAEISQPIQVQTVPGADNTGIVIGMHTAVTNNDDATQLINSMDGLAQEGVNLIVVEVGYNYRYKSHPELASYYGLSYKYARKISAKAKELGIELVPEIDCLGHQSWAETTGTLLSVYPQFDETIGLYPSNTGIYCRSWCPLNTDVNPVIFDLMDELIDAFDADAFHVGMDEVFLIGEDSCPRCKGSDKGVLFAKAVNDYYNHLVGEKGVTMYMWADRLLNGAALGDVYDDYDSSYNGTYTAIDQIPKDIILMDWHYNYLPEFPSVAYLSGHGFKVITSSYSNVDAAISMINETLKIRANNSNVLGHCYTTWYDISNDQLAGWQTLVSTIGMLK